MNERSCGIPEERWVDWHRGNLPAETGASLQRHLEGCSECRLVSRQWGEWLGDSESLTQQVPSGRLRTSLRKKVWKRVWRRKLTKRPIWFTGGVLAASVVLLAVLGLNRLIHADERTAVLQPREYAKLHEPEGAAMMDRPDTVVYAMESAHIAGLPAARAETNVTVWVNGRTAEIFVLLDGLLPEGSHDVQAWGAVKRRLTNLGLLKFHRAQGHLYSHIQNLTDVEELAFTIEPKGGSTQPTAPENARIVLARNK